MENLSLEQAPDTIEMIKKVKKITEDPKFIAQKGVRSIIDEDTRVGRKSRPQSFYGYKTEFIMTTDENIITSLIVKGGAYVDGRFTKEMLEQTARSGIEIKEVYGDKAYFRKPILDSIKELNAQPYIPISHCVYKIDESQYSYNKDADEWTCSEGNVTLNRKHYKNKNRNGTREGYKYYFEMKNCKACPKHDECAKKAARKILRVGINTPEYYRISQEQKTDEFREKYIKRASIESKNAEIKRFHGLSRARGYSLESMSKQAKLTALAVNIKRIAAIVSSNFYIYMRKCSEIHVCLYKVSFSLQ